MADSEENMDKARNTIGATVTKIEGERPERDSELLGTNALSIDDEFKSLYIGASGEGNVLAPPFNPKDLKKLVQQNNTLAQCIDAYESSIDGTGYTVEMPEESELTEEQESAIENALQFFEEPYPGESFLTQRKQIRRDMESTGYGYLEVIRNAQGEMVFTRGLESEYMRKVRLGSPVPTKLEITRGGVKRTVTTSVRYRRYIQKVGTTTTYFKEFGCELDLNKKTGEWAEKGNRLPYNLRASEIIEFGVNRDVETAYHVPRWINQLPSVLGSRQAEEFNLDFFYAGGIPPALIMISGGTLVGDSKKSLEAHFSGKANQNRAAIVEFQSTGGSFDKDSIPQVKVERFGSEQQKDSMFEGYDARCEERVRRGFRLPPLFLGKADAYNYATALISYIVAEQQVFSPERTEFDQTINNTIMRELAPELTFRSKALTLKDIQTQLKAIGMAADKSAISGSQFITGLNEISGTNLTVHEAMAEEPTQRGASGGQPSGNSETAPEPGNAQKSEGLSPGQLASLVRDYAGHMSGSRNLTEDEVTKMEEDLAQLNPEQRGMFDAALSSSLLDAANDPEGVAELISCLCGGTHGHQ